MLPAVAWSARDRLHQRQLEEYYCTLCYAFFDLNQGALTMSNSGLPYPIRCSGDACAPIELPGVPLGSFPNITYDQMTLALEPGDIYVFCTDGVTEASNAQGVEFGSPRLCEVVRTHRDGSANIIVDAIVDAVESFTGARAPHDDMTAVAVKITA